ncbi:MULTISPECIES: 1,4-alpha-glucan branching protein GlgB [Pontibacillus]|uniref:1,4-alpha-glucan branching enzyme GlgB n=1 Tax=Pontibacillus chungwhensis TaxID=265426 RepID=A0ABY8V2T3_9BACI|nr:MULTISPECIES: 1,4-alpha-glucan branching protein GlgB [Pontibacillus]MCD5325670.1 1,4-alpha-glucan branching protein GlgB [Pontibacillus sp. HN14]WIG00278.1 1,4-alpha-glucan branching protein GlgB [Pontibacillus chungwhensis]
MDHDIYLFHQGNLRYAYQLLGAHIEQQNGQDGVRFTVWAPHAREVNVVGTFNEWDGRQHPMEKLNENGLWSTFIPDLPPGTVYKYEILTPHGHLQLKADPYAFSSELRPNTASVLYPLDRYDWNDQVWMDERNNTNLYESPISIYELHLGSWKNIEPEVFYTYREYADMVIPYVKELGYTHIELLPITEHPFDRSWGYQATGYFAVTSRYGTPDDFKYFVDQCHQNGLGVILDWVPGHFCKDQHGLRRFDGEPLYEYEDPLKAEKSQWGTLTFDFGRNEVQSFLISNAIYWLKEYHLDGLRVDAVASMLYLSFGKEEGEWEPNEYGGSENLEAVSFIKKMNEAIFEETPNVLMMAEESTSWPLVSAPTYVGGLGFNYKWNMGWMNDMLKYMEMDPIHRKYHHNLITFSLFYAFSENFVLPISHDEVVHGKKSLLNKMPGDYWQKFANLRAFLAYMYAHPGKKLLFMGAEFGQFDEWKDLEDLDWELLNFDAHASVQTYMSQLHKLYKDHPALWELDHKEDGFEWVDPNNYEQSVVSFIRKGRSSEDQIVVICNFTPVVYHDYKVGVPASGMYEEVFSSDDVRFGGSGQLNGTTLETISIPWQGQDQHVSMTIPPLGVSFLKRTSLLKEDKS